MPNISSKTLSEKDYPQIFQAAFNDNEKTLSVNGFVSGKIGSKITITNFSTTIDDVRFLDVINTQIATTTNLNPVITMASTAGLVAGMYIYGVGIPANTTILSVDSLTQVTMSLNATASAPVTTKFANLLSTLRIVYDDVAHSNVLDVERIA